MTAYPSQFIQKLDATASTEAWPLIGLLLFVMIVTAIAIYAVGEIANSVL